MPNWLHHGVNNVAIECLPCFGKVTCKINPESMIKLSLKTKLGNIFNIFFLDMVLDTSAATKQ